MIMSIQSKLMEDMKNAMKAGDKIRLETIRGIRSQLKNFEIDKKQALTDDDEIQVLMSAAKKRKESIEQFLAVNRPERAREEEEELKIIQGYLPAQMGKDEIMRLIEKTIQEVEATSPSDMGKVMGRIMSEVKGKADGKEVQKLVQEKLATL
jgi:uncharacterized protein YqeY